MIIQIEEEIVYRVLERHADATLAYLRACCRSRRTPKTRPKASPRSQKPQHPRGRRTMTMPTRATTGDRSSATSPAQGPSLEMGDDNLVERQRSLGKLTVRERLDILVDPECGSSSVSSPTTWTPVSVTGSSRQRRGDRRRRDRRSGSRSRHYDFTVMAGSMGGVGEAKITAPCTPTPSPTHPVGLAARLGRRAHPSTSGSTFTRRAPSFREQVGDQRRRAHGRRHPRPLRDQHHVHPGLADFVPMVKGT